MIQVQKTFLEPIRAHGLCCRGHLRHPNLGRALRRALPDEISGANCFALILTEPSDWLEFGCDSEVDIGQWRLGLAVIVTPQRACSPRSTIRKLADLESMAVKTNITLHREPRAMFRDGNTVRGHSHWLVCSPGRLF